MMRFSYVPALWLLTLGLLALGMLVSCVPNAQSSTPTVKAVEADPVTTSYYPQETGLTWAYLPPGAPVDGAPTILRVLGPRVQDGERYTVDQLVGRGLEITTFRQYTPEGVFRAREEGPGYVVTMTPPIKELPSQGELNLGASWQGSSEVTLLFTERRKEGTFTTHYIYTVVDKRNVRTEGGAFEVFVINRESERVQDDEVVEELNSELWFAPYIGNVRNDQGQVLVGGSILEQR